MKIEDIKELFKETEEAEQTLRNKWLADLKFGYADDQWPEKLRALRERDPHGMRPCLTVNKIPAHARQIINDMRQSRAAIKVLPVDDRADVDVAAVLDGIVRHIEHVSNAEQAYSLASEYQVIAGIGFFRVDTRYANELYNEQEIIVNGIRNPFTVYMDPYINDITGADASYAFISSMVPEREYRRTWPKAAEADISVAAEGDSGQWFADKTVRVAEFWERKEEKVDYVFAAGNPYRADVYNAETHGPVEQELSVTEKVVHWTLLNGQEKMDQRKLVGQYIPIVRVAGEDYEIDGERHVHGIVRRARDAQQVYNYTMTAHVEKAALAPKAPWLVSAESIENYEEQYARANVENMPYLPYEAYTDEGQPLPPPQRQFASPADAGALSQLQMADGDIQATIGQFAASLGQPSNEKSGIAIRQRQQVGDIATYHYADNMGRAIKQAGRIIIDLIPRIYDTRRIARILGEDGDVDRVTLDPSIGRAMVETKDANNKIERIYNVGVGKYDIAVTVGPSYNTKRQEAFESMAQMTQGNPQLWGVIGDLLVKNMDWPGAQDMAERLKATIPPEIRGADDDEEEQMDPEVAAKFQELAAMVEQLGMQNQELATANQQMQSTIDQKVVEQQIKAGENDVKREELEVKRMELDSKRDEATAKLMATADKNETEYQAMAELVATAAMSTQQTQQLLAAMAESSQQQGQMIAAMLEQLAKPKMLSVETDADGNVVGGVSRTVN